MNLPFCFTLPSLPCSFWFQCCVFSLPLFTKLLPLLSSLSLPVVHIQPSSTAARTAGSLVLLFFFLSLSFFSLIHFLFFILFFFICFCVYLLFCCFLLRCLSVSFCLIGFKIPVCDWLFKFTVTYCDWMTDRMTVISFIC